jgi:hypothetical protein
MATSYKDWLTCYKEHDFFAIRDIWLAFRLNYHLLWNKENEEWQKCEKERMRQKNREKSKRNKET